MDLRLVLGFTEEEIGIIKSRRMSLSRQKRSGNRRTPVEEGDWKTPQGVSPRRLEISSTAGLLSGSKVFCLHQHWTVTELFDKEMASLRNGGEAGGMKHSQTTAQAKQLKTSPTARLPPVREGAYTTTGITILHRSFNQQTGSPEQNICSGLRLLIRFFQ